MFSSIVSQREQGLRIVEIKSLEVKRPDDYLAELKGVPYIRKFWVMWENCVYTLEPENIMRAIYPAHLKRFLYSIGETL